MSIEMTDAMRLGIHRKGPEPCWCTGGKVSARCKIHSQQQPMLAVSPGLHCNQCGRIPIFDMENCGCGGVFRALEGPIAAPSVTASAPVAPNPTDSPATTCGEVYGARKKRTSNVRKGGKMPNQTEARMLAICEARKRAGEIDSYRYEGLTLRWGRDAKTGQAMNYTPDVVTFKGKDCTLIECKGAHIYERDLVRFKGCRAEWSEYTFELWQYKKGAWTKVL